MTFPFPGIGILFDIDGLGGGHYGYRAWQVFMRNIRSDELSACVLVEGDALMKLAGSENVFCIGIYGTVDFRDIRERIEKIDAPCLMPMPGRIIDKPVLDMLPLPIRGNVDAFGRLVTESWNRMDHDLCKEAGWGYDPQQVPALLHEHLRTELHYMRVELPMQQIRRSPANRPSASRRTAHPPSVHPPEINQEEANGPWARLRRLLGKRTRLAPSSLGDYCRDVDLDCSCSERSVSGEHD